MNKEDIGLAIKELKVQSGNCHVREAIGYQRKEQQIQFISSKSIYSNGRKRDLQLSHSSSLERGGVHQVSVSGIH